MKAIEINGLYPALCAVLKRAIAEGRTRTFSRYGSLRNDLMQEAVMIQNDIELLSQVSVGYMAMLSVFNMAVQAKAIEDRRKYFRTLLAVVNEELSKLDLPQMSKDEVDESISKIHDINSMIAELDPLIPEIWNRLWRIANCTDSEMILDTATAKSLETLLNDTARLTKDYFKFEKVEQ